MAHRTDNLPLYQPRGAPGADRTIPATTITMPSPTRRVVEEPEGFPTYSGARLLKGSVPAKSDTYDPKTDIDNIYNACHGLGTDNRKLIKALVGKESHEIQILQTAYQSARNKALVPLVISETSGTYQTGMALLASGALAGDAYLLAMVRDSQRQTGFVVDKKTSAQDRLVLLTELIVMRSKPDLAKLKGYVNATQHVELASIVNDAVRLLDVSMQADLIEAFRLCMLPDERIIANGQVTSDVQSIKAFLEGKTHITTAKFLELILDCPLSYLRLLVDEYKTLFYDVNLSQAITDSHDTRLSSQLKEVLVYALLTAEHGMDGDFEGVFRDARRLEAGVQNEYLLTVRLVRAHWNSDRFRELLHEWAKLKSESPLKRVKRNTGSNLETMLVKMIENVDSGRTSSPLPQ